MVSDLYVFSVRGDSTDRLRTIRLGAIKPEGWIDPRQVIAAAKDNGRYKLVFLCGRNPFHEDVLCSEYPIDVVAVYSAYNSGNLDYVHACDVASDLLHEGIINEVVMDKDGKIVETKSKQFVVTCTLYGDSCDGHATKIGTASSREEAQRIIEDDKSIFRENLEENGESLDDVIDRINEIWYGSTGNSGRVYDVFEV